MMNSMFIGSKAQNRGDLFTMYGFEDPRRVDHNIVSEYRAKQGSSVALKNLGLRPRMKAAEVRSARETVAGKLEHMSPSAGRQWLDDVTLRTCTKEILAANRAGARKGHENGGQLLSPKDLVASGLVEPESLSFVAKVFANAATMRARYLQIAENEAFALEFAPEDTDVESRCRA